MNQNWHRHKSQFLVSVKTAYANKQYAFNKLTSTHALFLTRLCSTLEGSAPSKAVNCKRACGFPQLEAMLLQPYWDQLIHHMQQKTKQFWMSWEPFRKFSDLSYDAAGSLQ